MKNIWRNNWKRGNQMFYPSTSFVVVLHNILQRKCFNWKKIIKDNQIFLSFYFLKTYLCIFSKGQLGPPLDSTYLIICISKMCLFNKKTTHTHVIHKYYVHPLPTTMTYLPYVKATQKVLGLIPWYQCRKF
jgi:hypothetical protein